ncbi:MAG: hypothetical protein L3J29_02590 [Cyclobacteriaceae bacterium]|nr:hypothetical protein [Cyclobacteriaceae bacterium]
MTYLNKLTRLATAIILLLGFYSCETVIPAGVSFSSAAGSGLESAGSQNVQINLTKSLASEITLEVEYSGSADYSWNSTLITVPAGQTTADINFLIIDNDDYNPGVTNDVTIRLVGITGPGIDEATFGTTTSYSYSVEEDDMKIDLSWTPAVGVAGDHDLDLYLRQNNLGFRSETGVTPIVETTMLYGRDDDNNYQTVVNYIGTPQVDVTYTITLNFPDGSTQTNTDVFTNADNGNRTLWEISKSGGSYSATQDPFGVNGRIGGVAIQDKE